MKKCYICIPIAGRENDVFERAELAKQHIENLGYIPVNPLDLNEIGEKELKNHTEPQITAWYMGNDISMIIRDCDAIYCCDGWEYSKGCCVERECAKQYKKVILYQTPYEVRLDDNFLDVINHTLFDLTHNAVTLIKTDNNSDYVAAIESRYNYMKFVEKYFDLIYDECDCLFKYKKRA